MYKFIYKWRCNETHEEGISEAIVGAVSKEEALGYLKKNLHQDDFRSLELLDEYHLDGTGVLVSRVLKTNDKNKGTK